MNPARRAAWPARLQAGLSVAGSALTQPGLATLPLLLLIGAYALTVAVLSSLDALLVVSVVPGRAAQGVTSPSSSPSQ